MASAQGGKPGEVTESEAALLDELSRVNNELLSTQRALERRSGELDRAVERMNQLLGMAAHDLRNPIGTTRGLAQTLLLRAGDRLEPQELAVLERIELTSDRMLGLVDDLLDLSKAEHRNGEPELAMCDLRTTVLDVIDAHRAAAARKEIHLDLDAPDAAPLRADPGQLDEVVANLLSNAIKYSFRGGRVVLAVGDEADHVWLRVADEGVGIDPAEHETIFRPFTRAGSRPTEDESSTGLGLAIARRIVESHRGTISVTSTPGAGTTFVVRLPKRAPGGD